MEMGIQKREEWNEKTTFLKSDVLDIIAKIFLVPIYEISDIQNLKKGMTNKSFLYTVKGKKYIIRIPGKGTDQLINRRQEARVYEVLSGKGICDDPIYIDPNSGIKISQFHDGARTCNPHNIGELKMCMKYLKDFHEMNLTVEHEFNIFAQIEFYERLWGENQSVYYDYVSTKEHIFSLQRFITLHSEKKCLTHVDATPDNFLFYIDKNREALELTDWEYAGMQDPHIDIAMFCIYALYDKTEVDQLIDIYFDSKCTDEIRTKIYCYIAVGGLLWSNWCEYKHQLGIEFGEYSYRQYLFAKDYYRYAIEEIRRIEG